MLKLSINGCYQNITTKLKKIYCSFSTSFIPSKLKYKKAPKKKVKGTNFNRNS